MTAFLSRLLGCLPLLWFVFELNALPPTTRDYNAPTGASVAYDGAFVSIFGYDSAPVAFGNEKNNRPAGMSGTFVNCAEFLAANLAAKTGQKRASAGWFFRRGPKGYEVGSFPTERPHDQPIDYSDGTTACAAFMKREIEDIRTKGN